MKGERFGFGFSSLSRFVIENLQLFRELEDVEELLVDWTSISSMSTSDEEDPPQPESSVEEDIWKLSAKAVSSSVSMPFK